MRRVSTVLVLGVVAGSLASADIQFHDFGFKERRRSAKVAQLMLDAIEEFPDLNPLESKTTADELAALLALGQRLAEYRRRMESAIQDLDERVKDLMSRRLSHAAREAELEEIRVQLEKMASSIDEAVAIHPLAKRAYDLAKTYRPAPSQRTVWRKTRRTVKKLIPEHM